MRVDNQIIRVNDMGEAAAQAAAYGDEGYQLVSMVALDYSLIYLAFTKNIDEPAPEQTTDEENVEPETRRGRRGR